MDLHRATNLRAMAAIAIFLSIAVLLNFLIIKPIAFAASGINDIINFQGKIVTTSGVNIPNGTYNVEFKIYAGGTSTGGGTLDWTEDYLVGGSGGGVAFSGGTYDADLGSVCSFNGGSCETYTNTAVDWNSYPLYMSMQIGNTSACTVTTNFQSNCGGDGEMSPYILLTSTPYAINSGELGGLAASAYAQLAAGSQTFTGSNTFEDSSGSITSVEIDGQNGSTADTTVINTQSVTTAGINALDINYSGGSAAVEASAFRIDYAPGGTSGSTWNGMRIVANPSGAATGVVSNGLELDGPTTDNGGTNEAINIGTGWDIGLDLNSGSIQLADMTSDPNPPAASELEVYAEDVDGRSMLKEIGPSGIAYVVQPSLFQQNVVLITGGNGTSATTYTTLGSNVTATGTLSSTSGSTSEALGNTSRIATGTTADTASGFYTKNVYYLGSITNGADGFFYFTRMNLDGQTLSSYENATTGSRIFLGMCSGTYTGCVASDSPTTYSVSGFQLSGSRGDTNFQFITCNGSACHDINTGVTVSNADTYDFYDYTPPEGTTVYWRIDNLTTGTAPVTGSTSTDLPVGSTAMSAGDMIENLSAANRYLYFQRMYFETDR